MFVKRITGLIFTYVHFNNQISHHVSRGFHSSTNTWEGVVVQIHWPCCWCFIILGLGTTYTSPGGAGQMEWLLPELLLLMPLEGRCLMDLSHMLPGSQHTSLQKKPSNWLINPTMSDSCRTTFESDTMEPPVLLWRWTWLCCEWQRTILTNWIHLSY